MKRFAVLLAVVMAALVSGPLAAAQDEPPFRSPLDRHPCLHRYHYCNDASMDGGEHAFSWAREKLMRVFKNSCLAGIAPKNKFPFGEGWTRSQYQRR